jgi:hypothetical protein
MAGSGFPVADRRVYVVDDVGYLRVVVASAGHGWKVGTLPADLQMGSPRFALERRLNLPIRMGEW